MNDESMRFIFGLRRRHGKSLFRKMMLELEKNQKIEEAKPLKPNVIFFDDLKETTETDKQFEKLSRSGFIEYGLASRTYHEEFESDFLNQEKNPKIETEVGERHERYIVNGKKIDLVRLAVLRSLNR